MSSKIDVYSSIEYSLHPNLDRSQPVNECSPDALDRIDQLGLTNLAQSSRHQNTSAEDLKTSFERKTLSALRQIKMPHIFVDYRDALKSIDALEIFTLYAAQSKQLANPEQAEKEVKTLLKTLTVLEQLRASTQSSHKVDKIVVKRAVQLMNKVYTNCLSDAERKAFSKDFKKATTVLKKSS